METSTEIKLIDNFQIKYSDDEIRKLSHQFSRNGMIIMPDLIPEHIYRAVKQEAFDLLEKVGERIDLTLKTTDDTPRKMTIISHSNMVKDSKVIKEVYESKVLKDFLQRIARQEMQEYISDDEGLFIAKQHYPGDTHGWHWGDYSYALIWILETPPISNGGMLQCVPHTSWDKRNPRINQYLCENKIDTYGFKSGDVYFLKTDTTLHRTVELKEAATRVILNMTWGTDLDRKRFAEQNVEDTWWQNKEVSGATVISS